MSPHDVVATAKQYVSEMFAGDGAANIGLEELRFDDTVGHWFVTIGFTRSWDGPQGLSRWHSAHAGEAWPRTFKTVEIDDEGRVLQLRHWSEAA